MNTSISARRVSYFSTVFALCSMLYVRRSALLALCFALLAPCSAAEAQQPTTTPRIGYLSDSSLSAMASRIEAFRQGLRELGYVEGNNIVIEYRSTEGRFDRTRVLADELVRLKLDVIVSGGSTVTRALKEATSTIPIVFAQDSDPVRSRFVNSLARPGGNLTGLSNFNPELSGKRLELLKEIIPGLSRVAVLANSTSAGNAQALKELELTAGAFGVKLQRLEIQDAKDIETAFRAASNGRAGAVLALANPVLNSQRKQVIELAAKSQLPTSYRDPEYVEAGGLMCYGVNVADLYRRAATYVDKILKGNKPADLPVEQPMKFEFIVNLKAAKLIGLTIPPDVLARATRIIR